MVETLFSNIIGGATVGQARLYDVKNKRVSTEGMLQIGDAGRSWTAVCDYRWSCNHAVTACKQLGYSNPSMSSYCHSLAGEIFLKSHTIELMQAFGQNLDMAHILTVHLQPQT